MEQEKARKMRVVAGKGGMEIEREYILYILYCRPHLYFNILYIYNIIYSSEIRERHKAFREKKKSFPINFTYANKVVLLNNGREKTHPRKA